MVQTHLSTQDLFARNRHLFLFLEKHTLWILIRITSVIIIVRLSLLTMTNPNQLCNVLLFVCSKMTDETNLSSKLPVAGRTRKV